LLGSLRELASDGPAAEELQDDLAAFHAALAEPTEATTFLYGRASEELLPGAAHTVDELAEGRAAVTTASAAEALAQALDTMILTTPQGSGQLVAGLNPYPLSSPSRIEGRTHRLRGLRKSRAMRKLGLIAGPEGISLVSPDAEVLTVRFAECVAVKRWTDGTRGLWSEDGFYVEVSPEFWRDGDDVARLIDESVPASRIVPIERELEERAASVEAAAREKVKRGWLTKDELDQLPNVLDEGERVAVVAKASRSWRAGVVAVTDRRVVFLHFESVLIDIPIAAITSVESDQGSRWRDNSLTISTRDDTHKLTDIGPKEQLEHLTRAIEQARRGEG
jgi:hypothetical protein